MGKECSRNVKKESIKEGDISQPTAIYCDFWCAAVSKSRFALDDEVLAYKQEGIMCSAMKDSRRQG